MSEQNPNRLRVETAGTRAYRVVRDAILAGKLLPGAPLRELHLARDLGVSQSVVREALIQLETAGLVVRVPNSKTTVTCLSKQDVADRIAVRRSLEVFAVGEAVRCATRSELQGLRDFLVNLEQAAWETNPFELAQADLEFHRYLWRLSGNRVLCETLERTTAPLFATVGLIRSKDQPRDAASAISAHEELLAPILQGDVQAAQTTVSHHIDHGQQEFLRSKIVA